MADYSQITTFATKDSLPSGNAAKKIKGSDIDPEFSAISTAIATKYDSSDIATNTEAAGLVDDTKIITAAKLKHALENGTFALSSTVSLAADSVSNSEMADMTQATVKGRASGAGTGNPVDLTAAQLIAILNTGSGLDADTLDTHDTSFFTNATNLTSGTIPVGRVPAGAVTQHQASLSISFTQITGTVDADTVDGINSASFARADAADTISGAWTFTVRPKMSAAGGFLAHGSSTYEGGKVTVSTAAASGTPTDGDVWMQYIA